MAAHSAGSTPLLGLDARLDGGLLGGRGGSDRERSTRSRGRFSGGSTEGGYDGLHDEENLDIGEGSTMDIEDD